jgi:putative ABC transport system substrate-binding protein
VTRWVVAAALGLGLLEAPLALAQPAPGKIARIGYLSIRSGPTALDEAFRQGLRDQGWIEGRTISIEYRWADFKADRLASLAEELVRLKVDVLVAVGGNAPALAAKRATETIPVVFTAGDPVAAGIVSGLGRPGGNVTGVSVLTTSLNVKRLELFDPGGPRRGQGGDSGKPDESTVREHVEGAALGRSRAPRAASAAGGPGTARDRRGVFQDGEGSARRASRAGGPDAL